MKKNLMKYRNKLFTIIAIVVFCCNIHQACSQGATFTYIGAMQTHIIGVGVSLVSIDARGQKHCFSQDGIQARFAKK